MKVILLVTFCVSYVLLCQATRCPTIVTREQWGASSPELIDYVIFPLDMVIIHHTATETCRSTQACKNLVKSIQNYHIDNVKFGDIGYNFLIGGDGKVYEGRGWHKQGAHLIGYNKLSVGIAFIGNFNKSLPTDAAIKAVKDLMACGVELDELTRDYKLYGAKQLTATESPGSELFKRMSNWDHFVD